MALTRKFLSALGIEADKVDEIILAHSETVDALKGERDEYKEKADKYDNNLKKLEKVEKELSELKEVQSNSTDEWEQKYNKLNEKYSSFKADVEAKNAKQKKTTAFKKLLKEAEISEKRIDSIIKVSADIINGIEFDDDGNVKDSEKISEGIEKEWADFKMVTGEKGADTSKPPKQNYDEPKGKSVAKQLAEKYHNNLYGENGDKEE